MQLQFSRRFVVPKATSSFATLADDVIHHNTLIQMQQVLCNLQQQNIERENFLLKMLKKANAKRHKKKGKLIPGKGTLGVKSKRKSDCVEPPVASTSANGCDPVL